MNWDEGDLIRRIFDLLFPSEENIQRARANAAQRGRQPVGGGAHEGIARRDRQPAEDGAHEIIAQRDRQPAEDGAQAEIAEWDRQPIEGGEQIVRRHRQLVEGGEQIVRRRRQPAEDDERAIIAERGAEGDAQAIVAQRSAEGDAQVNAVRRGVEGGVEENIVRRGAEGGVEENIAQRGAEDGAQENIALIGGQPAGGGEGENLNIIRPIMGEYHINVTELFRRMNLDALIMCRVWMLFLLGSVDRQLSNEQRQMIEGYRSSLFYQILSENTVHRRAFVIMKSEVERRRGNVPDHIIRVVAVRALEIISIINGDRLHYESSAEQGLLGALDAFCNITLLIVLSIFIFIMSFIPLMLQKFFLPPPNRRYQNGHRS